MTLAPPPALARPSTAAAAEPPPSPLSHGTARGGGAALVRPRTAGRRAAPAFGATNTGRDDARLSGARRRKAELEARGALRRRDALEYKLERPERERLRAALNATLLALLPALALGATAAAWAPRFAALRAARRDASERVESSLRLQTFFKARRARARAPCRGRS